MNITWCVAHTQPLKELVAKQNLLNQGYDVYLPRFKKICRHARKTEEKMIPLFPRYIFVGMDLESAEWRSVNGTRGVSHLLMRDELRPARVSADTVAQLRSQEIAEGVVSVASLMAFTKGDRVRIADGAFKDQIAIFESMDDQSRIQLLLNFMDKELRMTFPQHAIEAA